MTTAITRATITIVRVSMAPPCSVSLAASQDPPSGTPLPLTDGWERPERLLAGSRSGRAGSVRDVVTGAFAPPADAGAGDPQVVARGRRPFLQ
jgi:hypothetical protein